MRGQQMMPGLYDPTGLGFEHPDGGVSTELNTIVGRPGNYRMIPMLVPGQTDTQNLLAGRPATEQQYDAAARYARTRDSEVPKFKTVQEAEDYEQRRHKGLDQGYRPQNDADLLSWLYLALNPQR